MVISGPTAVGKTEAAIAVAQHFQTEIVSADARQFYRELNIGVARPTAAQLQQVPHHFIGHLSVRDPYSAGAFARDALPLIARLHERHPVVVLTGGSGLFIKAVTEGLDSMPPVAPEIVAYWKTQWEQLGLKYLQESLARCDPQYYQTVDLQNPHRLIRALSVYQASGRPYSSFRKGTPVQPPFEVLTFVLDLPNQQLRERIRERLYQMLEKGLIDEATSLYTLRHLRALQTVGYRELFAWMEGRLSQADALASIQTNTWHYARRQRTWWRRQRQATWIHAADHSAIVQLVAQRLSDQFPPL